VSAVHLIVVTQSSGPPASGKIIKELPGSVASGTSYSIHFGHVRGIYNDHSGPVSFLVVYSLFYAVLSAFVFTPCTRS